MTPVAGSKKDLFAKVSVVAAAVVLVAPTAAFASAPSTVNGVGSASAPRTATVDDTSAQGLITFELGAPCVLDQTAPLGQQYSAQGVHFRGSAPGEGGAVLGDCAGFGVTAHSGTDFLAFNEFSYATSPELIVFDSPQQVVQLYVADGGGDGPATFTLSGRQTDGTVVTSTVTTESSEWSRLRIRSAVGISGVRVTGQTSDGGFVVDDLGFATR